jgi:hypothetical protein
MSDHNGCQDCKHLSETWIVAVSEFSEAVARLRDVCGNGNEFAQVHRQTEVARQTAEHARMALELRRSENGSLSH